jgi:predicted dehydrogenase
MVKVGIIGVGYWGTNLVRAFNDIEGAAIVRVAERKAGRVQFVEKRYPHVKVTPDYEDILNDPTIDAVIVSTPVPTHFDIASRVLRAGKHVFVEKPLAYSSQDAAALVALANKMKLVLAVGHVYQFSPAVTWLAKRIESQKLGKIFHIDSARINLGPPHSEVNVLWDLAPHDLSIILHLVRSSGLSTKVTNLQVMADRFTHASLTDMAHVFIRFECGITAHVHVSWVAANKVRLMQISTEVGTVVFDDIAPVEKIKVYSEAVDNRKGADDSNSVQLSYRPGDIFIPTLPRDEPLSLECRHFIECVQSGAKPINGGEIGLEVVTLLERISRAIDIGANVFSEPVPQEVYVE